MLVIIKKLWSFLAEFSGVISSFIFLFLGFSKVLELFSTNKLIFYLSILIFILAFIWLLRWIIKNIPSLEIKLSEIQINEDIKDLSNKNLKSNFPVMPTNPMISTWFEKTLRDVKAWASDATFETISLFIKVTPIRNEIFLMSGVVSIWKNSSKNFYVGKDYITGEEELRPHRIGTVSIVPFYKKYPNWQKALNASFIAIKSNLPEIYQIVISSHYSNLLNIEYQYSFKNKMNREIFGLEDNILTNNKNNTKILI